MGENANLILVPWDFSEVAEYALEHALKFADITKGDVSFVHVIKKEKDIDEAKKLMDEQVEKTQKKYNRTLGVIIREGNIFKTITDVVSELHANLVIMGTHGMKGMQKFTGSWALKVIAGSEAPFVVVQEAPKGDDFTDIVFPVDFRSENKEKLKWANYFSQYFKTKLHICKPNITDPTIKKKTTANLNFYKKYLDERQIDYEIHTVEGTDDFAEATIRYAKEIDAGGILIMTTKNLTFQDYVLGANEQKIIANEAKIPVICVNPRTDLKKAGFFYA